MESNNGTNATPINPAHTSIEQKQLEEQIYKELTAPFSKEAYSKDTSRGFALTSIKAQYIVERLNTVLGVAGWRQEGKFETVTSEGQITDVLYFGKLIFRIGNRYQIQEGVGHTEMGPKKGLGDAYKGAKTDCLSKTASLIGVGNEVFKGNVDPITFETKDNTNKQSVSVSAGSFKPSTNKESARYGRS